MGGGYYSQDVAREARSTQSEVFGYRGYATDAQSAAGRRHVHPILNIHGKIRECMNEVPVVVALDVTRSRGKDTKVMYEKLPMFIGQIEMKNYLKGAAISFAAIGDAASGDQAPLQVGQFEADNRLDEVLSKFWIEEGGGGTGQESYELAAYYYARHTKLQCVEKCRMGYFFFVGDEGFYPTVDKKLVKDVCGVNIAESIDSRLIFKELQEKFHVFLIYPRKSWQERKADIDAEIMQRVESAGGQYKDVDFRASLIWDNTNDLDLHVVAPSGEEIFFGHKRSACQGWLDVDMNVHGESIKPVENIRWAKGTAKKGRHKVFIQNFRFHEKRPQPSNYRVEVEINGKFHHFEGVIGEDELSGSKSNISIGEFYFDPAESLPDENAETEIYEGYSDDVIKNQWLEVIPKEQLLLIDDPRAIVDVMLGTIAIVEGTGNLDSYLAHMKERGQTKTRVDQTIRALEQLAVRGVAKTSIQLDALKTNGSAKDRRGSTKRLGT